MVKDFSWKEAEEDGSLIFRSVKAVAVYPNPNGDVVVRQEAGDGSDEDHFIVIPIKSVNAVIAAMRRAAKDAK